MNEYNIANYMTKDFRNSYDFFDIMQTMLTKPFYIIYNSRLGREFRDYSMDVVRFADGVVKLQGGN